VGDRVRVRRQRWRVADVRSYDACRLLTLSGIGADNTGTERRIITPFDFVEPLERTARLRIVRLRRWRQRLRTLLAGDGAAGSLRSALRARMDLLPHQLEPALALVRGSGSRVLIADEVGLGKTVQAGLIVSELQELGAADRILVLTPAGLREQWAAELANRFDLDATIVDAREARRRAALLPTGLNPWTTAPVTITSIDYAKRPEVFPAIQSCRWDAVVVDEAHGVASRSDRHHAVSSLCGRAAYVVLLTATPHNGDRAAFESLCGLGSQGHDRLLVFRRSRQDVRIGPGRRVHGVRVRSSADEIRMHEQLARFTRAVRADRGDVDRDAWLALTTLHKRALSSARSLEQSVVRRLSALQAVPASHHQQLALPLDDGEGELNRSDEAPVWTSPALDDAERERGMLIHIAATARAAGARETKLATLAKLLARLHAMGERSIVFTEYRDTLLHVQQTLKRDFAVLHGGMTREQRRAALGDFQRGRRTILLATDAGGEGLNLHQACRVVINLELPWNPMRLEQRIGRVDRIGQARRVHAFNLIARDTGETRILDRLKARIALARQDIGTADPLESAQDDLEEAVSRLVLGAPHHDLPGPRASGVTAGPGATPDLQHGRHSQQRDEATGDDRARRSPGSGDGQSEDDSRLFIRLASEAASEHARLLQARGGTGAGPGGGIDTEIGADVGSVTAPGIGAGIGLGIRAGRGPLLASSNADVWLAFARNPATRSRLVPRVLVVLQSTFEDSCGRLVAAHLTPLMVHTRIEIARGQARGAVAAIIGWIETVSPQNGDTAWMRWKGETTLIHHSFWATRRSRERAIATALAATVDEAFQPGLFDRRAERRRLADAEERRALGHDRTLYEAMAERAAVIEARPTRAVLVLVP
jgi:superfamily II DNA or RNA helicase